MAEILPFLPVIAMSGIGSLVYFIKEKRKYKLVKKTIYTLIKKGIDELDFEVLAEGVKKLKDFDIKYTDMVSGAAQKKFIEKVFRIKRVFKMDKFEKLFNIPKEAVEDLESIREHFMGRRSGGNNLSLNLNSIMEEERKETEVVKELKVKLEKIKIKQLAQNNAERQVIDNMNFTDKISQMHQEYEKLFIDQFENEKDLQNILQRGMKKQMILKRMKQIQDKNAEPSTEKMSC